MTTIAEQLIEEGRQKGRAEAREEARQKGREEGQREVRVEILRKLLVLKFKLQTVDPACEAHLQVATSTTLDRYLERVLTADSLAAVFAD